MIEVARRYRFGGFHHVPGLPVPWCEPHPHVYTVEVVARGEGPLVVDTDLLDEAWWKIVAPVERADLSADLDAIYGPENTTVEALAARWLDEIRRPIPEAYCVTVWEDDSRWGRAS